VAWRQHLQELTMASWREIDRIRKASAEFRSLAKRLLGFIDLTDWEKDFLASIRDDRDHKEFTTRQSEKLLQIRDDYELVTEFHGLSVKILLRQCRDARLDLSEDDEEWIQQVFERNETSIRRKNVGRLMRCARELNIIEEEFA
jgi:hypothetical protein